ncbi:MAG: HAD family hydrolase, partial [Candidatus Eremiobacteraeota bacterium]|nr:HAD family hydrolase [Candidatus Eremiobacteraeota bacterium]
LIATALRHGIALDCITADYGQTIQQSAVPESSINRAEPDAVLIALDHRGLPLGVNEFDEAAAANVVAESVSFVETLRAGFRAHAGAPSIVQTVAPPAETLFGNLERSVGGTSRAAIGRFNDALVASVRDTPDVVFDVAALAEVVGLSNWHDATQWHVAKFAFDAGFLPLYADHVCRIIAALRGKSRRCLVLDLDNTLWGGVIGDDGLEGIVLGQGSGTGEAFLDIQRMALGLRRRGIVLAVSSKNDDAIARVPFARHPEMLLREEHIAVFSANWNDKASNIVGIARELSLGIDAMVFFDDNPAERSLVRRTLPAVAIPELPLDPALFGQTLLAAGYFEAVAFSEEDRKRAGFYRDNARRAALQGQVADIDGYLASLAMRIVFAPFDATGRSRIAQLVNKSNQFNVTTRRYAEADVAAFEADPRAFTLQVRLVDTFGDNGMIAVVIVMPVADDAWEIDTWLMSCRVLGRRVEQMVLREIVHHARAAGIRRLIGRYLPTERNGMVADLFEKLGFRCLGGEPPGETLWEIATDVEIEAAPMDVERSGFATVTA